jgi:hypothetical protein
MAIKSSRAFDKFKQLVQIEKTSCKKGCPLKEVFEIIINC